MERVKSLEEKQAERSDARLCEELAALRAEEFPAFLSRNAGELIRSAHPFADFMRLKLREKGLLNVFTPFAELYHFESISRGLDDQGEKAQRYNQESEQFRAKWKTVLEAGDPYYNPNFSLDKSDFSLKIEG